MGMALTRYSPSLPVAWIGTHLGRLFFPFPFRYFSVWFLGPSPFLSVHNGALFYFPFSVGFILVIMFVIHCLGCHLTPIVGDTHDARLV